MDTSSQVIILFKTGLARFNLDFLHASHTSFAAPIFGGVEKHLVVDLKRKLLSVRLTARTC